MQLNVFVLSKYFNIKSQVNVFILLDEVDCNFVIIYSVSSAISAIYCYACVSTLYFRIYYFTGAVPDAKIIILHQSYFYFYSVYNYFYK